MVTEIQKTILDQGKVFFCREVEDSDKIVVQATKFNASDTPSFWFYLYDSKGNLVDVQKGQPIDLSISQRKPVHTRKPFQGPKSKKERFSTVELQSSIEEDNHSLHLSAKPKKVVKRPKKDKSNIAPSNGRKYNISEEVRIKRAEAMRIRMKNYWAKKKAET